MKTGIENIIADANRMAAEEAAKKAAETQTGPSAEELAAKTAADATAAKEAEEAAAAKAAADAEAAKKAAAKADPVEDEEPADDGEVVKMPKKAFQERLDRAARSTLKKLFGTDNQEEIAQIKTKADEAEKKAEAQRRAEQTEIDRLKEDAAKAEARAAAVEARERARQEQSDAEAEEKKINVIAVEFLDPEALELAHFKFAKHLKKKSEDELAEYTDENVRTWYKNFAEKNPKYKKAAATVTEEAAPPKVARAVSVGASDPKKPSAKNADPNAKVIAPGKANSMTQKEWAQYKKDHNISY